MSSGVSSALLGMVFFNLSRPHEDHLHILAHAIPHLIEDVARTATMQSSMQQRSFSRWLANRSQQPAALRAPCLKPIYPHLGQGHSNFIVTVRHSHNVKEDGVDGNVGCCIISPSCMPQLRSVQQTGKVESNVETPCRPAIFSNDRLSKRSILKFSVRSGQP